MKRTFTAFLALGILQAGVMGPVRAALRVLTALRATGGMALPLKPRTPEVSGRRRRSGSSPLGPSFPHPSEEPSVVGRLATQLSDWIRRGDLETLYLRKQDPWRYRESRYEHDRFDAMWKAVENGFYPNIMEIGCGEGFFSKRLVGLCRQLVCLDLSRIALARTRRALLESKGEEQGRKIQLVRANLRYWNPGKLRFDLIVAGDVLYYLDAPRKLRTLCSRFVHGETLSVLQGIPSWLKPGGLLLLCHGFGNAQELALLQKYHNCLIAGGMTLLTEQMGKPSDKGPTRFLLNVLQSHPA